MVTLEEINKFTREKLAPITIEMMFSPHPAMRDDWELKLPIIYKKLEVLPKT
jgi:hypothetical protein